MSDRPVLQYVVTPTIKKGRGFVVVAVFDNTAERIKRGKRPRSHPPYNYSILHTHPKKPEALAHANSLNVLNSLPIFDPKHLAHFTK